jgi:hypothetical protein
MNLIPHQELAPSSSHELERPAIATIAESAAGRADRWDFDDLSQASKRTRLFLLVIPVFPRQLRRQIRALSHKWTHPSRLGTVEIEAPQLRKVQRAEKSASEAEILRFDWCPAHCAVV